MAATSPPCILQAVMHWKSSLFYGSTNTNIAPKTHTVFTFAVDNYSWIYVFREQTVTVWQTKYLSQKRDLVPKLFKVTYTSICFNVTIISFNLHLIQEMATTCNAGPERGISQYELDDSRRRTDSPLLAPMTSALSKWRVKRKRCSDGAI